MPAAHSDFFLNCCRPKALRYVRGPCAHALSPFYGLRGGPTLGARTRSFPDADMRAVLAGMAVVSRLLLRVRRSVRPPLVPLRR